MASPEVENIIELQQGSGSYVATSDDFDAVVEALRDAEGQLKTYKSFAQRASMAEPVRREARITNLRRVLGDSS